MTYKAIVKELIRTEAETWVEKLLKDNNIEYKYTSSTVIEMENDKKYDHILWQAAIDITFNNRHKKVVVGGTADDVLGICKSVVWDGGLNIIWMSRKETRDQLGITEFKIA